MSIDLEIIPTEEQPICWSDLKEKWLAFIDETRRQVIGPTIELKHLGTDQLVGDSDLLVPGSYFYFELAIPNTLGLSMPTNERLDIAGHESEIVADYGRNLTPEMIRNISQKWGELGYGFGIYSGGGRGKHESALMVALASALASLCEGWVGVGTPGFGDAPRMYTAEQFRKIQPDF